MEKMDNMADEELRKLVKSIETLRKEVKASDKKRSSEVLEVESLIRGINMHTSNLLNEIKSSISETSDVKKTNRITFHEFKIASEIVRRFEQQCLELEEGGNVVREENQFVDQEERVSGIQIGNGELDSNGFEKFPAGFEIEEEDDLPF